MLPLLCRPGVYCLIYHSGHEVCVRVGKLDDIWLRPGFYTYVGSAMHRLTGVLGRVAYHALGKPADVWNVDHVKPYLSLIEIWFAYEPSRPECQWAAAVGAGRGAEVHLKEFGARDCKKWPTH
jgi:Uri superfamily endonuclease